MSANVKHFRDNVPPDVLMDDKLLASYMRLLNDLEVRDIPIDKSNVRMLVRLARHRVLEDNLFEEIKDATYMTVAAGDKGLDIAKANQTFMGYAKFAELTNKLEQALGLSPSTKKTPDKPKAGKAAEARKKRYDAI